MESEPLLIDLHEEYLVDSNHADHQHSTTATGPHISHEQHVLQYIATLSPEAESIVVAKLLAVEQAVPAATKHSDFLLDSL